MYELSGGEQYDVYYAFDTESVFATVKDGIANRAPVDPEMNRGDRSLFERVASRETLDRLEIEAAYRGGDKVVRRKLLEAAGSYKDVPQVDLLRLALFSRARRRSSDRGCADSFFYYGLKPWQTRAIGACLGPSISQWARQALLVIESARVFERTRP